MATVTREEGKGRANLVAALKGLQGVSGKVGWPDTAKYPDGTPAAYVAAIQEFGCPEKNIPPRMGLRELIPDRQASWAQYAEHGAKQVLAGNMTAADAMELVGARAEGDIRKQIASVLFPPLAESTLKNRAHNLHIPVDDLTGTGQKPLVEPKQKDGKTPGGYMLATVTHIVSTGAEPEE